MRPIYPFRLKVITTFDFKKAYIMDYSSFINLNSLSEEARKELQVFYEYLIYKYSRRGKKLKKGKENERFSAIELNTVGFKFNRDEANER
jgi:hypothetical protein